MDDVDENALIVNALQRHASIVVQKSLVEGFGLTVTEALWKSRPMIASAVGGIQDQIIDMVTAGGPVVHDHGAGWPQPILRRNIDAMTPGSPPDDPARPTVAIFEHAERLCILD